MHNIPTEQPIHTITSLYSQSEPNSDAGCKDRVVFIKEMVYEESITAGVCLPTLSVGILLLLVSDSIVGCFCLGQLLFGMQQQFWLK